MAHNHCDHQLRLCLQCDTVWCAKCSKEWGGHHHGYNWPYDRIHWTGTPILCSADTPTITLDDSSGGPTPDHVHNLVSQ